MLRIILTAMACSIAMLSNLNLNGEEETAQAASSSSGCQGDSLMVLFWNLENFFDPRDDGQGTSDHDFSPGGNRHWNAHRFYRKCSDIAKSIYWISSRYGHFPDLVGFAEVENGKVLHRLLQATTLRKMDYGVVHYDSPDHRGIDVALLYRRDRLQLLHARPVRIPSLATRDLLSVEVRTKSSGRKLDVVVCHLPSKYGGSVSGPKRALAASVLRSTVDSVYREQASVVVMGDFNDVPVSPAFDTLRPVLQTMGERLFQRGEGTIRFNGEWELIDQFWLSPDLSARASMEILRIPFLLVAGRSFPGEQPFRTYSGPRYVGGVSDHCPILLLIP